MDNTSNNDTKMEGLEDHFEAHDVVFDAKGNRVRYVRCPAASGCMPIRRTPVCPEQMLPSHNQPLCQSCPQEHQREAGHTARGPVRAEKPRCPAAVYLCLLWCSCLGPHQVRSRPRWGLSQVGHPARRSPTYYCRGKQRQHLGSRDPDCRATTAP